MDGETHEAVAVDEGPGEANAPSTVLLVTLFVPVFAVVLWFMIRIFTGRWIVDPPPPLIPPPPGTDDDDPR